MTSANIDEAILSAVGPTWTKVAMVLARASAAPNLAIPADAHEFEFLAERIEALIAAGRLLSRGDVKLWRHSEVRKI